MSLYNNIDISSNIAAKNLFELGDKILEEKDIAKKSLRKSILEKKGWILS